MSLEAGSGARCARDRAGAAVEALWAELGPVSLATRTAAVSVAGWERALALAGAAADPDTVLLTAAVGRCAAAQAQAPQPTSC